MPTMPDVIGMNYQEAQDALQAAGIYVAYPVYAFLSAPQISIQWQQGASPTFGWTADSDLTVDDMGLTADAASTIAPTAPGSVVGQVPGAGSAVKRGAPITLTLLTYPMGAVVSPGY